MRLKAKKANNCESDLDEGKQCTSTLRIGIARFPYRLTQSFLRIDGQLFEVLTEKVANAAIPDLVRVFLGRATADSYKDQIREAAKAKDHTFLMEGGDTELAVLAGAVIANLVSKPSARADAVALTAVCADVHGFRRSSRLQSVMDEVLQYLSTEAVRVRESTNVPMWDSSIKQALATKAGVAINSWDTAWSAVDNVFTTLLDEHLKQTKALNSLIKRQREDSDILWWLFSEHTHDGKKAFRELKVPEACFWGARRFGFHDNIPARAVSCSSFSEQSSTVNSIYHSDRARDFPSGGYMRS